MKFNVIVTMLLFSISSLAQDFKVIDDEGIRRNTKIDTLQFSQGKAQVFLIQIPNRTESFNDTEINELQKNFSVQDFNLKHISLHTYIRFENGQFIDLSDFDNSYEAVVLWNGDKNEDLKIQTESHLATEFVSRQLGQNKKSSYVINSEFFKNEIDKIKVDDNFTENSREVMNRFLKQYSVSDYCFINDKQILNLDQKGVSSIIVYRINSQGKKIKQEQIFLNKLGYPTKTIQFDYAGKAIYYPMEFYYEDGILRAIIHADGFDYINYNDNSLFYTSVLRNDNETIFYELKDDNLVMKRVSDLNLKNGIEEYDLQVEQRVNNNCIDFYIRNKLWSTDCFSQVGVYPFTHSYTSFKNGNILQTIKSTVTKINNSFLEEIIQNSISTEPGKRTIILNERSLVESILYQRDGQDFKNIFEYTYYD